MQGVNLTKLEDVAYLAGRIGWKGLTAKEYTNEGPLFLSVHGLNYGDYVDFRDAFHISQERYDESPEIMLQKDDILLCKDGAGIGKLGIVDNLPAPASINSSLLLIRALEGLFPKYLYYSLCSPIFQRIVQERIDGATTPHLYQREIKLLEIPIPPLEEQKRIVGILDEAFQGIDQAIKNTEQNLQNARDLFESYLNNIFTQKGEGWISYPIKTITTVVNGHAFKSGDFSADSPIKSIKITNVGVKKFVDDLQNNLPADFVENFSNKLVYEGDVVVALTRTLIADGLKVARVPRHYNKSLLNQRVAALRPHDDKIINDFLHHYFCTDLVLQYVKNNVNTLMQPNLSINDLKNMPVPTPPLEEQQVLVNQINDFSSKNEVLIKNYQQKLTALKELKQSLLQKAFAGKLTAHDREVA